MRGLIPGLENPYPLLETLPAVYHEDDFATRLTAAFDEALAPAVGSIENLDAYVDPLLAPLDFVEWLAEWVGFPIGQTWPEDRSRELVERAVELFRWRGTVKGLKDLIRTYTGLEPEVEDSGGTTWSSTPNGELPPKAELGCVVRVRKKKGTGGVDTQQLEALIHAAVPAHVPHRLEVRG